jgi:hypothetical protein
VQGEALAEKWVANHWIEASDDLALDVALAARGKAGLKH